MVSKKLLILFILGIILGLAGYFLFLRNENDPILPNVANNADTKSVEDLPFKELTVPYLRQRQYSSQLGDLEKISENSSYTSYLTSYDSDGFKVNGLLTVPKGEMPIGEWPAVVFVHGYIPPASYATIGQYADYVDYLSRNGLVVFKIDLRGHGNSEGEAGGSYFGSDYIIDVLNARDALAGSGFANIGNIGLWGHSMAGNVVTRAFAARPDIKGVVVWAGAVYTYEDMRTYGISDSSYQPPPTTSQRASRRQELFDRVGSPSAQSEFWQNVAFTNFLDDLSGSLEIHHAVDDNVVSIEYSRNLMDVMDGTRVPHTLYEYPSGGHNISGSNFNLAMQRTVDFFKKTLVSN